MNQELERWLDIVEYDLDNARDEHKGLRNKAYLLGVGTITTLTTLCALLEFVPLNSDFIFITILYFSALSWSIQALAGIGFACRRPRVSFILQSLDGIKKANRPFSPSVLVGIVIFSLFPISSWMSFGYIWNSNLQGQLAPFYLLGYALGALTISALVARLCFPSAYLKVDNKSISNLIAAETEKNSSIGIGMRRSKYLYLILFTLSGIFLITYTWYVFKGPNHLYLASLIFILVMSISQLFNAIQSWATTGYAIDCYNDLRNWIITSNPPVNQVQTYYVEIKEPLLFDRRLMLKHDVQDIEENNEHIKHLLCRVKKS